LITLGVTEEKFYVPYTTESYEVQAVTNSQVEKYADITDFVTYDKRFIYFQMHCDKCIEFKIKREIYECKCAKKKKTFVIDRAMKDNGNLPYYVRDYQDTLRVYKRSENGIFYFMRIPHHIIGFPRNAKASLIYPYRMIPLTTFFLY